MSQIHLIPSAWVLWIYSSVGVATGKSHLHRILLNTGILNDIDRYPLVYKPLWTMHSEFIGSYLTWFAALTVARFRICGTLGLLYFTWYLASYASLLSHFSAGLLLCHLYHHDLLRFTDGSYQTSMLQHVFRSCLLSGLLIIGLLIGIGWNSENHSDQPVRTLIDVVLTYAYKCKIWVIWVICWLFTFHFRFASRFYPAFCTIEWS